MGVETVKYSLEWMCLVMEAVRPVLDAFGLEFLEHGGQTIYPFFHDPAQPFGYVFYIGKEGADKTVMQEWMEFRIPENLMSEDVEVGEIGKFLDKSVREGKAWAFK